MKIKCSSCGFETKVNVFECPKCKGQIDFIDEGTCSFCGKSGDYPVGLCTNCGNKLDKFIREGA